MNTISGNDLVRNLLLELADQVVDHAVDVKSLKSPENVHGAALHERKPLIDIIETTNCLPILAKHNDYEHVVQLQVLRQRTPFNCGFHTFHNAYLAMKATLCKMEHTTTLLKHMNDVTSFWWRYKRLERVLLSKAAEEGNRNYPWTDKHITFGVMERPYMSYLLEQYEEALEIDAFVAIPDLSIGSLKNGVMEPQHMRRLQSIFDEFQRQSSYSYAFLVGTSNHWVALVANKYQGKVELLLLDSRNEDILNKDEDTLKSMVKEYFDRKERQGMKIDHRKWREETYLQSLRDTQASVELIYSCITGRRTFLSYCLDLSVEGLMESFHKAVPPFDHYVKTFSIEVQGESWKIPAVIPTEEERNDILAYLDNWMTIFWPPKMILEAVYKIEVTGLKYLSHQGRISLSRWHMWLSLYVDFKIVRLDKVKRLQHVLSYVERLLQL